MELKIRKSFADKLVGKLLLRENYIVWSNDEYSVLLSNNFLEIKEKFALNVANILKILGKITEQSELSLPKDYFEIKIPKNHNRYILTYKLMILEDSESEKELQLTSSLLAKQKPEIELIISNDLKKIINGVFDSEITMRRKDLVYLTDNQETINIPSNQPEVENQNESSYSYETEFFKSALNGFDKIEKITYQGFKGLAKMTIKIERGIEFYYYFSNMTEENGEEDD